MAKRQPHEVLASWIKLIREEGRGVTAWEEEFVESVADHLEVWGEITQKQEETLERIYADRTS